MGIVNGGGSGSGTGLLYSAASYGVVGDNNNATAAANGAALDRCIAAAEAAGDGAAVEIDWNGTAYVTGSHKVWKRLQYSGTGYNVSKLQNGAAAGTHVWQTADFAAATQTIPASYSAGVGQYEFTFLSHVIDGNKANNATGGHALAIAGYGYRLDLLFCTNAHQAGWWSEWNMTGEPIGGGGSNDERAFAVGRVWCVRNDCAAVAAANTRATQGKAALTCAQAALYGPGDSWISYLECYRDGSVTGIGVLQGNMDFNAGSFGAFDLTINNCTVWLNHATAVDLEGSNCIINYIHSEGATTNLLINNQGARIYGGKIFGPQTNGVNISIASGFNFGTLRATVSTIGTAGITHLAQNGSATEATFDLTMDQGFAVTITATSGAAPTGAKEVHITFNNWGGGTVTPGWLPQITGSATIWAWFYSKLPISGAFFTKAGAPTNADTGLTANGMWAVYKDSAGATLKLYANDGGVLKSVALA